MKYRGAIRSLRKVVIRTCIFLLLGAIVNIAVAWGFSMRSVQRGTGQSLLMDFDTIDWWLTHAPEGFALVPAGMYEMHRFGSRTLLIYETEQVDRATSYVASRIAHGWPLLSLEHTVWMNRQSRTSQRRNALRISGRPFGMRIARSIPLQPVWPGFAINTLFYAAIIWLLWAGLFALRRRRRVKRGLCPACAYPVGTSDLCTECGKAVKATSAEPGA